MAVDPVRPAEGEARHPPQRRRGILWLLLLPFVALLIPPLYARAAPHLWGIPFFYWYQAVWLAITMVICTVVYRGLRR